MSGIKDKHDDSGDWTIRVQKHKGELKHDTNSESCWCLPTPCQPCQSCQVVWYEDSNVDVVGDEVDKSPLAEKFRAQADDNCLSCHGRGLVSKYDDEAPYVVFHR